jgi:hypothetical protein
LSGHLIILYYGEFFLSCLTHNIYYLLF